MPSIFNKPVVRLHLFGYVFTPNLLPTLAFLALLPLLISLGIWQLNRAAFKQNLQAQYETRQSSQPISLNELNKPRKQIEFYPIRTKGRYDNRHQFLIDNRVESHRVGFYVMTPFIPRNKPSKLILVNRGWIPRLPTRQNLPRVKPIRGMQTITGILQSPPTKTFTLGNDTAIKQWPKLLQTINFKLIERMLKKPIYPYVVLLSPNSRHGFLRNWQPNSSVTPQKHWGYAMQWFALALTLVIIYIIVNTKKRRKRNDEPESD